MRISPTQYFQENGTQYETPNYILYFIIISIVAGVALGLAIGALAKK